MDPISEVCEVILLFHECLKSENPFLFSILFHIFDHAWTQKMPITLRPLSHDLILNCIVFLT